MFQVISFLVNCMLMIYLKKLFLHRSLLVNYVNVYCPPQTAQIRCKKKNRLISFKILYAITHNCQHRFSPYNDDLLYVFVEQK